MAKIKRRKKEEVGSKYWDRVANAYGVFTIQKKEDYEKLRNLIEEQLTGKERVLEVGAGVGNIMGPLAPNMKEGVGIDLSCNMIEKAKKTYKAKNVEFRCEDATTIKEEDDSFDIVIASNILHIVPEPDKVLEECFRVLRPKGLLIAPNFIIDDALKTKFKLGFLRTIGLRVYNQWDYSDYQQFLSSHGFCVLKTNMIDSKVDIAYVICTPEKGMRTKEQEES